ncbi:MAG TPA: 4-hydroxy-3-methylbut-2-enyl diphosphate reductase, partial [Opitutales bacterium]|nr:4-hydroxy-3-methylbut-2-enyl diphosphate reductase [Opitutales bacterium]
MKIIRAQSAGFCWGVERAIKIARSYTSGGTRPVFSDGPLIHNRQMMQSLEAEGIREIGDYQSRAGVEGEIGGAGGGVMVVRAHGVSPERREYLKSLGLEFRDATCPDVGIVAGKIRMHARSGYSTIIFGDRDHPEVIGLLGYTEGRGHAVQSCEDVAHLPPLGDKVCLVSQTTMFTDDFEVLADCLRKTYPSIVVIDTICGATKARQGDIARLVEGGAEVIVVIGGHHSANTCKLAVLARRSGLRTFHIETADELGA